MIEFFHWSGFVLALLGTALLTFGSYIRNGWIIRASGDFIFTLYFIRINDYLLMILSIIFLLIDLKGIINEKK